MTTLSNLSKRIRTILSHLSQRKSTSTIVGNPNTAMGGHNKAYGNLNNEEIGWTSCDEQTTSNNYPERVVQNTVLLRLSVLENKKMIFYIPTL